MFGGTRFLFSPEGDGGGDGAAPEGEGLGELPPYAAQLKVPLRLPDLKELGADLPALVTNARTWRRELAEAKAAAGQGGLAIPAEKDPPEKLEAFRKAMGIPGKAEEYTAKLKLPQGVPADLIKPEEVKEVLALFHGLHVTDKQAQALLDIETARAVKARAAYAKAKEEEAKSNLEAFRAAHPKDYKELLVMVSRTIEFMGGKELREEFDQNMGNNPRLLAGMAKIAPLFNEKGLVTAGADGGGQGGEVDLAKVYPQSYHRMMGKAG